DVEDAWLLLAVLFQGVEDLCADRGDFGDDGVVDISDVVALLGYLYQSKPAPGAPLDCGVDPTPDLLPPCELVCP
ncbi:MAG: hypothetical protein AAF488_10665, partial [Planctomycetota bacterium]